MKLGKFPKRITEAGLQKLKLRISQFQMSVPNETRMKMLKLKTERRKEK